MAYKMATGMGARLENVLPTPDPTNPKKKKNNNNESTVTVSRTSTPGTKDGMKGYWHTTETRTTTPGSRGNNRPSYAEFAAQGGDVAAARAYNAANERTPNTTNKNVTREFVGRVDSNLQPKGIVPQKETPAKLMPTPKPTVTVTPPPRPAWEKPNTYGKGGKSNNSKKSGKGWNSRGLGEMLRGMIGSCKTC